MRASYPTISRAMFLSQTLFAASSLSSKLSSKPHFSTLSSSKVSSVNSTRMFQAHSATSFRLPSSSASSEHSNPLRKSSLSLNTKRESSEGMSSTAIEYQTQLNLSYKLSDRLHELKATMNSTSIQSKSLDNSATCNAVDRFTVGLVTFVSFSLL